MTSTVTASLPASSLNEEINSGVIYRVPGTYLVLLYYYRCICARGLSIIFSKLLNYLGCSLPGYYRYRRQKDPQPNPPDNPVQ